MIEDYNKHPLTSTRPALPEAEFWKSNGDELLFTFEVTDPHQLVNVLILWKKAVQRYREHLQRSSELDVKATAWTAGFPLMNTEVVFEEAVNTKIHQGSSALARQAALRRLWHTKKNGRKGLTLDFIGPSIDTGFRLSQLSTAEQMTISLDLAYCIARHTSADVQEELRMYYAGARPLKGVLGGRAYPVFWVFMGNDASLKLRRAEDALGPIKEVKHGEVGNFCQLFYDEHTSFLIKPFIQRSNGDLAFGDLGDEYEKAVKRLQETAVEDQAVDKGIDKAANAVGAGETPAPTEVDKFIAQAVVGGRSTSLKRQSPNQESKDSERPSSEGEPQ